MSFLYSMGPGPEAKQSNHLTNASRFSSFNSHLDSVTSAISRGGADDDDDDEEDEDDEDEEEEEEVEAEVEPIESSSPPAPGDASAVPVP